MIENESDAHLRMLGHGSHVCMVYDNHADQLAVAIPFIMHGLAGGECCAYIADDLSVEQVKSALSANGVSVDTELRRGSLRLLTKRESYLRSGSFDPAAMVEFLEQTLQQALARGFTGLRVSGEMTWALGTEVGCERLIEYEARIDQFLVGRKALALCQYNRQRFSPAIIKDVLRTHPLVILGRQVCSNVYYEPPELILVGGNETGRVDWMLAQLQKTQQESEDRRLAVQALRKSELQQRLIAEHAPAGLVRCDAQQRFRFVNRAYAERLGLTPDDLIGKTIPEVIGREAYESILPYIEQALAGNRVEYELEVPYQQIGLRTMHCAYAPEYDSRDAVIGWVAVISDVTERRRAEKALRNSELRFRILTQSAPVGIFLTDAGGRCEFVNGKWCEFAGMTEDQALGTGWVSALHPEDANRVISEWYLAAEAGSEFSSEYRFLSPQGKVTWLQGSAVALRGEAGQVTGYLGTITDITARLEVETRLKRSQERLDLAQQAGRIGTFEWNIQTNQVEWSATEEQLFGLAVGSFGGRLEDWQRTVHPDDRERATAACLRAVNDHIDLDTEFRIVRPNGEIRHIAAQGKVSYAPDGKPIRMVGVNVDITERKLSEESLLNADRRKDEFLATLAHELRNPLAPISNAVQLIKCAHGDAAVREQAAAMMERQLGQMVRLIDDLLDLSRITRNKLVLQKEWVELAVIVQSAVETARPLMEAEKHQLSVSIPREPILLHGDMARLSQILSNLLTNAAKYTDPGGQITLAAQLEGSQLVVTVADMGIGISPEKLPQLFEMFVQGDCSLEKARGGLGIGLTLVKRLTELHGGTVEAHSDGPGCGSRFSIRLPLLTRSISVQNSQRIKNDSRTRLNGKVLVVDDNVDSALSLALLLRSRGAEVQTAHDGLQAVLASEEFQPNIIFMDIGMPHLNGYDAAVRIREQPWFSKTLLIAMTGWGQQEDKRKAIEAGFHQHLTKPVSASQLEPLLAGLRTSENS